MTTALVVSISVSGGVDGTGYCSVSSAAIISGLPAAEWSRTDTGRPGRRRSSPAALPIRPARRHRLLVWSPQVEAGRVRQRPGVQQSRPATAAPPRRPRAEEKYAKRGQYQHTQVLATSSFSSCWIGLGKLNKASIWAV